MNPNGAVALMELLMNDYKLLATDFAISSQMLLFIKILVFSINLIHQDRNAFEFILRIGVVAIFFPLLIHRWILKFDILRRQLFTIFRIYSNSRQRFDRTCVNHTSVSPGKRITGLSGLSVG